MLKSNLFRFVLIFILLFVVGCGAGDSKKIPAEASINNSLIVGTDVGGNGIWDHLDNHIETNHPGAVNQSTREALIDIAEVGQEFLLAGTKEEAVAAAKKRRIAMKSLWDARADFGDAVDIFYQFQAVLLNTEQRVKRYLENDRKLSGEIF